jgi:rhamnulokinase
MGGRRRQPLRTGSSTRVGSDGSPTYAAVDIGAESGRVLVGGLRGGRVELAEVHRFANRPVRLPDGLHWDPAHLFTESLAGLEAARAEAGELDGVAVDAWAVDYGLLDDRGQLLGLPFHYRDQRTRGMMDDAFAQVPARSQYGVTGIQALPINTVFQLRAEADARALAAAERLVLMPDLLSFWLCGELVNERTVASTTGLLDAGTGSWALPLIDALGLPRRLFGPLVEPGTVLGPLLGHHSLGATPVIATAAHDTAAAFAAAPLAGQGTAVLSSGTWSLLGLELPGPVLTDAAREANLSNERGVEGTTRLLKNVMGLWLVQECRRAWEWQGVCLDYEELMRLATGAGGDAAALFDPDHEALLAPGEMPSRIAALCAASGEALPAEPGGVIYSVLLSLACKYRFVLELLERAAGHAIDAVNVIGGGSRNQLLCELTADLSGRPVMAGPLEASGLGNLLLQARACGELGSPAEIREVARASTAPRLYEPSADRDRADSIYERFLAVTELPVAPSIMFEGADQ